MVPKIICNLGALSTLAMLMCHYLILLTFLLYTTTITTMFAKISVETANVGPDFRQSWSLKY